MDIERPTRKELLEALEAMIFPAYGAKLRKRDGKGPCTRGMDLLLRERGIEPQGVAKAAIRERRERTGKRNFETKRGLGF